MNVLRLVAGILSLIFTLIFQVGIKDFMKISAEEDNKVSYGMLVSSIRKVNCYKLRSQLLNFCKEKDVYQVKAVYQLFLDNCFEDKKEIEKKRMKEFFENFLDSFLNDEEKEIEELTRKNTQSNKESMKADFLRKDDEINGQYYERNDRYYEINDRYDDTIRLSYSLERKKRKQVQINPEPEIKLIEKRRHKKNQKMLI